jgi:Trk K+ transport system NAD-binding subunit
MVREFRDGVVLFVVAIVAGAATFQVLWNLSQAEPIRFIESLYLMLTMTFFQPVIDFPKEWFLDLYFFVMPVLGLIALARGAADFASLLFNRRARQAQWEEAVASTFSNHVIVCGLGRLGIRVVRELVALDQDVVVIEQKADSPRFDEVRSYGIPVIVGDGRNEETLRRAGVERAETIIICTNDDLMNLQMVSRVRELNKNVRLVMRMFDDQFARSMADRFDISTVISASMLAAPAFAGAALGTEIVQTFRLEGKTLAMGRIEVQAGAPLAGMSIASITQKLEDLSVVLLVRGGSMDIHPAPETVLQAGDVLAVVASLHDIKVFASQWNRCSKG